MMTKERLQEIKDFYSVAHDDIRYDVSKHVLELIAEAERCWAIMEPTCGWRLEYKTVSHVGPPDTTTCVQVPVADARDGGL